MAHSPKLNKMKTILICILFFITGCAHKIDAKVIYVYDGDTIKVLDENNNSIVVRFADIDCPEKNQPYGQVAKYFVSQECLNQPVRLIITGSDKYGRTIATVYYTGINLNQQLLTNGLAWYSVKYSHNPTYEKLFYQAKQNHIGLWSEPHPINPSKWRHSKH